MTRYVIRKAAQIDTRVGITSPLVPIETDLFIRRIEKDTRRGMRGLGYKRVLLTQRIEDALSWATREAAVRVAAERSSDYETYEAVPDLGGRP